jgi:hypothetical protein
MAIASQYELEYCPNCGSGVESLNPITGWCKSCSKGYCENCDKKFKAYQNSRTTCRECRENEWLERNADKLDEALADGLSLLRASIRVHNDNRPRCVMCGSEIKHGTKGRTIFCGKRDECRRAAIRFNRYRKRKGMSYNDALEKVLA